MVVKRMDWVDIAKGITIIFMIIGHTVPISSGVYTFIFSFHMPLFVILSGITYRSLKNIKSFWLNIKKYFKRLFIPYLITLLICRLLRDIQYYGVFNLSIFIKNFFSDFIWGNGCSYVFLGKEYSGVGSIWFLITLFLSKIVFDFINLIVKDEFERVVIYSFLMIIMITFSFFHWLPWGLDLVFIFTFYLYIGYMLSVYKDFFKKYFKIFFAISFLVWMICLFYNIHIELAVRSYPLGFICILESLCGSYCVIRCCQFLEKVDIVKKIFIPIGKLSLLILCVHTIEKFFIDWSVLPIPIFFFIIIRIFFDIGLSIVLNFYKKVLFIN